jgi:3-dehydroquinate dehydratase-1
MICIPIMAADNGQAIEKMREAALLADVLEIRLDLMDAFDLEQIVSHAAKPVIVTYRSKKEGGRGRAPYKTRVRNLIGAIEAGADYVDVEFSMPQSYREEIFQAKGGSRLIISAHLSHNTPGPDRLAALFKRMAATGADIVKLVTYAKDPADNLRVLGLIPLARDLGVDIIAFCMGPAGRLSRIFSLVLGGYMSFAALSTSEESASGQIPIKEMKRILEILSSKP